MVTVTLDALDVTGRTRTGAKVVVGRSFVSEPSAVSYLAAKMDTAALPRFRADLAVADGGHSRFAGEASDIQIDGHKSDRAQVSLTAVGPLARWGQQRVGDVPWPVESIRARAERIAALIGQSIVVQGGEWEVAARDVDSRPAIELLAELADDCGGWMFDHQGRVYLQALDYRKLAGVTTVTWQDDDPDATWDDLPAALTWDSDDDPSPLMPMVLDPHAVAWEPVWAQSSDIVNRAVVAYGAKVAEGDQPSVVVDAPASIAEHGVHDVKVTTRLANEGDALTLANLIVARAAQYQWVMGAVRVRASRLPAELLPLITTAMPGVRVTVTNLPQVAPAHSFPGVLEGWEETWDGPNPEDHWIVLHLSHASQSMAVPTWDAEPAAATWDDLSPTLTWEDDL